MQPDLRKLQTQCWLRVSANIVKRNASDTVHYYPPHFRYREEGVFSVKGQGSFFFIL